MILGNINDTKQIDVLSKDENLKIAFDYIMSQKYINDNNEKILIKNDEIFAFKNVLNTTLFNNVFELHHRYIDMFFCIKGQEDVYITKASNISLTEEYNSNNDIVHGTSNSYHKITLYEGDYILLFPDDAHSPGKGNNNQVEKLVIKVKTQ